ncbi:MAG: sodium:solute symporter, partial [Thermovirgaceae bacterium]
LSLMARWLREEGFSTVPDVIVRFYGNHKPVIIIASLMCIIAPLAATATSLVAFGKLFSSITGIPVNALVIAFALVNVLFILPAGLKSVAWTDFLFGCLMVAATFFTMFYAIRLAGGWSQITASVPTGIASFPGGLVSVGWKTLFLWSFALIPGTLTMQMYYQRIYAIDSAADARKSLIISILVILTVEVFAGVLGMAIRTVNPDLAAEGAAGWFLTQLPTWFLAMYSAFIVITLLTTTNSMIQSIVVNVTRDIFQKVITPGMDEKTGRKLTVVFSFLTAFVAVVFAVVYPQALGWLLIGYSYSAAGLLFPIFLGYLLKDRMTLSAWTAMAGMLGGIGGCMWGQTLGAAARIPYVGYGLLASLVCMLMTAFLTRNVAAVSEEVTDPERL